MSERNEAAESAREWISVDIEPTKDRNILLVDECGNIFNGYLCLVTEIYKDDASAPVLSEITHWMPLPDPPE